MDAHLAASKPVHLIVGRVTASAPDPLEISIDQKLILSADFLIVPESLMHLELHLQGDPVVVRQGLTVGDRVLLLRVQGGQRYVVFDRVVLP